jgi:hypothetical protein
LGDPEDGDDMGPDAAVVGMDIAALVHGGDAGADRLAALQAEAVALKAQMKANTKATKNAQQKRRRLMDKASGLNIDDLGAVIAVVVAASAKAKAKAKAAQKAQAAPMQ